MNSLDLIYLTNKAASAKKSSLKNQINGNMTFILICVPTVEKSEELCFRV